MIHWHVKAKLWLSILLLGLLLPQNLLAQKPYFPFFQQEYFFGLLPSVRAEGMGRTGVLLEDLGSAVLYNPANLGGIEDWEANLATAAPYYLLRESDQYFLSYGKRINDKFVAALSLNQFNQGPSSFTIDINFEDYEVDRPVVSDLVLSLAGQPLPGLTLGVNAHYFSWKIFDEVSRGKTFYLDLGATYEISLGDKGRLDIGASVFNSLGASISFSAPDGNSSSNWLPIIGRYGIAYRNEGKMSLPGIGETNWRLLLTSEIQDLYNSEYRTAFRLGSETLISDFFALRLGVYTRSENDFDQSNNRDRLTDITYGFGVIIPLNRFTDSTLPFDLHVDYYSLANPPLIFSGTRIPNRRGFGIRLIAPISEN